jgi:Lrp/AsnC family transcriptional regulator, leucine-responsive regulatory protein
MSLDLISLKLLSFLRHDSRTKYAELGKQVHLSAPAVFDRVKKLETKGVIRKYTIDINPNALELETCAFVQIGSSDSDFRRIPRELEKFPEIEECHGIAGQDCFLVKVRTKNTRALSELLQKIRSIGATNTVTTMVLETYFERGVSVSPAFSQNLIV